MVQTPLSNQRQDFLKARKRGLFYVLNLLVYPVFVVFNTRVTAIVSVKRKSPVVLLHVALLALGCFADGGFAHHGADLYNTTTLITIDGKVIDFEIKDPHSYLLVEVIDDEGHIVKWLVEGGSSHGTVKAGLSKRYLSSQPFVRIRAYPSRDGACFPTCKALGRAFEFDRGASQE